MLASLAVLIFIIAIILRQYLNGTVLGSFVALVSAFTAMMVSFGYYELLANFIISKGYLVTWAHAISLIVLYGLSFAILWGVGGFVAGTAIHFSDLPDKVISCGVGAIYAAITAGVILTALTMTPIPSKWLYSRYDTESFDLDSPSAALVPADSLAVGLFSTASTGSMKGGKSFAAVHPNFLNQIHLNNLNRSEGVIAVSSKDALATKTNGSYWRPEKVYVDASTGENLDEDIMIVRAAVKGGSVADGGAGDKEGGVNLTLAQFKLIVGSSSNQDNPFASAESEAFYPIGYVKTGNQVTTKPLPEIIKFSRSNFSSKDGYRNSAILDLVFEVPQSKKPVALTFRSNSIAQLNKQAGEEEIPGTTTFVQAENCETELGQLNAVSGVAIKPVALSAGQYLMSGLRLNARFTAMKEADLQSSDNGQLEFDDRNFICGKATFSPLADNVESRARERADFSTIPGIINTMPGFAPVALKVEAVNNSVISSDQFPVLIDTDGNRHHAVGLLAGGSKGNDHLYQFDYCSKKESLDIKNNVVSSHYPEQLWIGSQVDKITEFYLIYNVNIKSPTIILNVESSGKQTGLKDAEGFLIDRNSTR